jgi:hypothetical protein
MILMLIARLSFMACCTLKLPGGCAAGTRGMKRDVGATIARTGQSPLGAHLPNMLILSIPGPQFPTEADARGPEARDDEWCASEEGRHSPCVRPRWFLGMRLCATHLRTRNAALASSRLWPRGWAGEGGRSGGEDEGARNADLRVGHQWFLSCPKKTSLIGRAWSSQVPYDRDRHFGSGTVSRLSSRTGRAGAWPAAAADNSAIPNFSPDSRTGWVAGVPDGVSPVGRDFLQPPSGPGPVTFDKAHPYVDTAISRKTGAQPTLRIADLSNPIPQPWVREELRKVNERALTAIVMFTPKERCWTIGVPGFLLYPVTPVYFLQTPKEVVMIWEEDHMARHVYLTDRHSPNVKPYGSVNRSVSTKTAMRSSSTRSG